MFYPELIFSLLSNDGNDGASLNNNNGGSSDNYIEIADSPASAYKTW